MHDDEVELDIIDDEVLDEVDTNDSLLLSILHLVDIQLHDDNAATLVIDINTIALLLVEQLQYPKKSRLALFYINR